MNQRILIIRLSALGDIINTLPVVPLLRRYCPDLAIDWVVEDRFQDFVKLVDGVDQCIPFPRQSARPTPSGLKALLSHRSNLRGRSYLAAIDFQGNLKGAIHLFFARAGRKIGLERAASREGAHLFARERVLPPEGCHRAERALALLRPICDSIPEPLSGNGLGEALRPRILEDPLSAQSVEQRLTQLRTDTGPLVVLHPGTSKFGAFKRWHPRGFGELARRLSTESGALVLVSYGPGERPLAQAVVDASSGSARFFEPSHGLPGLVALLRRADLVVAADSGPLLLASALGTRTVALFGPKNPRVYAPPFGGCTVVRHPVPCSPCSLRRCEDPICMSGIEPERVFQAALPACLKSG
ncbi:MAG: glycosyltransferase family 9 protein [Planctomycetota bacterium]